MQEQNFEKQVQKKLEELNLSPSAPVWKKVEEQIRKKKDRRRIFFWLLPFAVLGGGVYFYSIQNKPGETTSTTHVAEENIPEKKNSQTPAEATQNNSTTTSDQSIVSKQSGIVSDDKPSSETEITTGRTFKKSTINYPIAREVTGKNIVSKSSINQRELINDEKRINKQKDEETRLAENSKIVTDKLQNNEHIQNNEKETNNNSEKSVDNPSVNNNNIVADSSANNKISIDTINKTPSPSETKDSLAVASANEIDTPQKTQVKAKTKKPWKFSASFAGGSSGIATSAFGNLSQGGAASLDAVRFYNVTTFTQSTGNGPITAPRYPSDIKNAFSFAAGAGLNRELSDRLQFSTGLLYHFYSTSVSVGKKVYQAETITRENKNITVENFYQSSNAVETNSRKNNYHFVELPVGVDWQVSKNVPLQLQTGFRIGRLIKTNALHYDGQQGIYYEDEKLFKQTQFSFYTGIFYRILKINKASLYVGPKAQFQISNLLQKKSFGEQHLYFTGVETYVSF